MPLDDFGSAQLTAAIAAAVLATAALVVAVAAADYTCRIFFVGPLPPFLPFSFAFMTATTHRPPHPHWRPHVNILTSNLTSTSNFLTLTRCTSASPTLIARK